MYSRAGTAKSMNRKGNKVGDMLVDGSGKYIDPQVEDVFMAATSRKGAFQRKNSYNSSYDSEDQSSALENKN
jgi:hypothetical protein